MYYSQANPRIPADTPQEIADALRTLAQAERSSTQSAQSVADAKQALADAKLQERTSRPTQFQTIAEVKKCGSCEESYPSILIPTDGSYGYYRYFDKHYGPMCQGCINEREHKAAEERKFSEWWMQQDSC